MVPLGMIVFGSKVDAYGPKKFVFLGGILFGIGMVLTGFATSIPLLYATYGSVLGLGIGAAYGATTSVAVKWFPDKKGLAGGLTAAGFGSVSLTENKFCWVLICKFNHKTPRYLEYFKCIVLVGVMQII